MVEWVELTLGARFTVGLILRPPNGTNFESGLDSLRSLSVAVVSRDEARLFATASVSGHGTSKSPALNLLAIVRTWLNG